MTFIKNTNLQLTLVAKDHGYPTWYETLSYLTVLLVDINDNRPEFPDSKSSNPYMFYVSENDERNLRIGILNATFIGVDVSRLFRFQDKCGRSITTQVSMPKFTTTYYPEARAASFTWTNWTEASTRTNRSTAKTGTSTTCTFWPTTSRTST